MLAIRIKIISFISNNQPGFVECNFLDAYNREHIIHEKIPIVTDMLLDADTEYPQDGFVACDIIKRWMDNTGRKLITVTTERPWGVRTITSLTEFDLEEDQLTELNLYRNH